MKNKLKFQLDFLPIYAHYNNLRYLLKKDVWNHIKNEIRKEKKYTCEFCKKKFFNHQLKFLECHEYWVFNISNKKQILKKLILLCHYCHLTQHVNFSHILNSEDKVIEHFKKINNLSTSDFNELKRKNLLYRNSVEDSLEFHRDDLNKIENWTLKIECNLTKYLPEKLKNDEFIYFLNNLNWRNQ